MPPQELVYFVGLALYAFEDWLANGSAVTDIIELLPQLYPNPALEVFKAVTVVQQQEQEVVETQPVSWDALKSGIEAGEISRFQIQEQESSFESDIVLWGKLDITRKHPESPNHLRLKLPRRFFVNQAERATRNLLIFGKRAFETLGGTYAYSGVRIASRSSSLVAKVINATIDSIPLGDFFDVNIDSQFQERVKGAFWANFLNARHVEQIGGAQEVRQTAPCHQVAELGQGGLVLILSPNPVWQDEAKEASRYARLRQYLAPITVSTKPSISPALEKMGVAFRKSYNI